MAENNHAENANQTEVSSSMSNLSETASSFMGNISAKMTSNAYIYMGFYTASFIVLVVWLVMVVKDKTAPSTNTSSMNAIYSSINKSIQSIDPTNSTFTQPLCGYYIQSAYDCCSTGSIPDGTVSLDAMINCMKQGCRFLDFQIFCYDKKPIVACSSSENHYVIDSYNFLLFSDVFVAIIDNAFSPNAVPNPKDPLFLSFRFKTNEQSAFQMMANLFSEHEELFLPARYSYESYHKNFGAVKLNDLAQKIVIFVDSHHGDDKQNTEESRRAYESCADFYEYVNFVSGQPMFKVKTSQEIMQDTNADEELAIHNNDFLTVVYPSPSNGKWVNMDALTIQSTGSQFLCMMYQFPDANLTASNTFFNSTGYAFALKPVGLRDPSANIFDIPEQSVVNSYAPKTVTSPFFQFSI